MVCCTYNRDDIGGHIVKKRRFLFVGSVFFNIFFVVVLGFLVLQRGGIPFLIEKVSTVFGVENNDFVNTNPDYLKKQSLYDLMSINESSSVFLGDSIISGAEWSEIFQSLDYVNRGIPGDNSLGVLNRLDKIVESKPKKIFIMIGVNDLSTYGNSKILLENYKKIIDKIQVNSPNTKIYVQSVLPFNEEEYLFAETTKMSNKLIRDTNLELSQLAKEKDTTFIDLYSLMALKDGKLNPDYTFDGLHLSGDAYMIWKNELAEYLK